jgi:hypothetical protein
MSTDDPLYTPFAGVDPLVTPPVDPVPGRPTVQDVANLLRARTKDDFGNESGTFTDKTRPTADDVERHIDVALALVSTRLPTVINPELHDALAGVVTYRAALRVEKSYFPEQVQSERSAYDQLYQEYLDDLAALVEAANAGGSDALAGSDVGVIPVGSWTSIGHDCVPPADTVIVP